mmetsp:Transcript_93998/g.215054  ORF Transcript_93998/g.215054 Transcript_93998/m.215054 type:complete len:770 (-) Transcript_93998:164-2473(-)
MTAKPYVAIPHPAQAESTVLLRLECEALDINFAASIDVKSDGKLLPFNRLVSGLASIGLTGDFVDVRQELELKRLAWRVRENQRAREEQFQFYAAVEQRFAEHGAIMLAMKRDYYREISRLQSELSRARRDPNSVPDDVCFFDVGAYKMPAWDGVVQDLDALRMKREILDAADNEVIKHIPIKMLCKTCRDKFQDPSVEAESHEDAEVATKDQETQTLEATVAPLSDPTPPVARPQAVGQSDCAAGLAIQPQAGQRVCSCQCTCGKGSPASPLSVTIAEGDTSHQLQDLPHDSPGSVCAASDRADAELQLQSADYHPPEVGSQQQTRAGKPKSAEAKVSHSQQSVVAAAPSSGACAATAKPAAANGLPAAAPSIRRDSLALEGCDELDLNAIIDSQTANAKATGGKGVDGAPVAPGKATTTTDGNAQASRAERLAKALELLQSKMQKDPGFKMSQAEAMNRHIQRLAFARVKCVAAVAQKDAPKTKKPAPGATREATKRGSQGGEKRASHAVEGTQKRPLPAPQRVSTDPTNPSAVAASHDALQRAPVSTCLQLSDPLSPVFPPKASTSNAGPRPKVHRAAAARQRTISQPGEVQRPKELVGISARGPRVSLPDPAAVRGGLGTDAAPMVGDRAVDGDGVRPSTVHLEFGVPPPPAARRVMTGVKKHSETMKPRRLQAVESARPSVLASNSDAVIGVHRGPPPLAARPPTRESPGSARGPRVGLRAAGQQVAGKVDATDGAAQLLPIPVQRSRTTSPRPDEGGKVAPPA